MAITYNNLVKSIGYNQHSILKDIMDMHNYGKPFDADITYSKGNFYGHFKRIRNDGTEEEFDTLDQFFLLAKSRLHSGKIKTQQHARKFSSTFYVFKKTKKKIKYLECMTEEERKLFIDNADNI